uniref:Uncharacterized protein n=1 Tax=Hordeum vulgare subsp. vulgare TaxID=112509 RepID=A0A8I6WVE0_HORVV
MDVAKSSSIPEQQEGEMDGSKSHPVVSEQQTNTYTTTHDDDEEEDELSDDSEEDETPGVGAESISKPQIQKLRSDLQAALDYLRLDIEPAAPLRETITEDGDDDKPKPAPVIPGLLEQFKDLCRRMSRLRWKLVPFKQRYEEEQSRPVTYEGLDEEEKARKIMEEEEKFFDSYRQSTEFSSRRVTLDKESKPLFGTIQII